MAMLNNNSNKYHNKYISMFIFLGLIIGAVITNLAQFPVIEKQIISPNYSAINSYKSSNLAEISRSKAGPTSEANNSFYLAFSEFTPGAILIIPVDSPLCIESLYGLGRLKSVEECNYDPETFLIDLFLDDYVVHRYKPKLEVVYRAPELKPVPGEFAFALKSFNPERLIALRREEAWFIVDTMLLPANAIEVLK
jgi:hypothetical protein